jgi:hypothetical protein
MFLLNVCCATTVEIEIMLLHNLIVCIALRSSIFVSLCIRDLRNVQVLCLRGCTMKLLVPVPSRLVKYVGLIAEFL